MDTRLDIAVKTLSKVGAGSEVNEMTSTVCLPVWETQSHLSAPVGLLTIIPTLVHCFVIFQILSFTFRHRFLHG